MNEENSLWMGDISPDLDEATITQSFQYFNIVPINIKLIKDKKTNTNRNYCFVFFKNIEDRNKALNQLNGKIIPKTNMTFKLNLACYHSPINRTIYVGNLNKSINNEILLNFFQMRYPSASKATVIKEKSISKGYGFVVFKKENEYRKSLEEMDGAILEGNKIVVREQKRKVDDENNTNNNILSNKLNNNFINNNFDVNSINDYQINDNMYINNINNDLLINYNLKNNNNAINDLSLLTDINLINNNEKLKNDFHNNNYNMLSNNGIININDNKFNQNINNIFNFENKNILYKHDKSDINYICNNSSIINPQNINNKENNKYIDINRLILMNKNNSNISNNLNNHHNDNINFFNNLNNSINLYQNKNNINNGFNFNSFKIKRDINNISNIKNNNNNILINNKKNNKNSQKLEILEKFDEKTLIKKIRDSINNTFHHYKKLSLSNDPNNIKSKLK